MGNLVMVHGSPASRPKLPWWRQALIELLLSVPLIGGILLWFPLIRVDAFWVQFEGPSLFGLSLALALVPALLIDHLTFRFFDVALEHSGEMAADRGGGPDAATALVVQLRPFRSRRVRRATTFLVFFNLFASASGLALWHRHSTAHASERLPVRCRVTGFTEGSDKDPRWRLTFECPLPGAAPATARTRLPEWQWLASAPPPQSIQARLQRGGLGGWLLPLETVELEAAPRPRREGERGNEATRE